MLWYCGGSYLDTKMVSEELQRRKSVGSVVSEAREDDEHLTPYAISL